MGYYVTMKRDRRTAWLLGPYETHAEALAKVERGRHLARSADPFADFDAFGTSRIMSTGELPPGVLNTHDAALTPS